MLQLDAADGRRMYAVQHLGVALVGLAREAGGDPEDPAGGVVA
jgi:hypothetical protein